MPDDRSWFERIRCSAILAGLYLLTIAFAVYIGQPYLSPLAHSRPVVLTRATQQPRLPVTSSIWVVAGRPVRLVIADDGIDLPVDEGFYNSTDDSWTLIGYHAQFAM